MVTTIFEKLRMQFLPPLRMGYRMHSLLYLPVPPPPSQGEGVLVLPPPFQDSLITARSQKPLQTFPLHPGRSCSPDLPGLAVLALFSSAAALIFPAITGIEICFPGGTSLV